MKKSNPKDQLLDTAARLFFPNGYRAIGVDTIAAESGIGKMTLYRHYESKDELIVAYLRDSDTKFWEEFEKVTGGVGSPRQKLIRFFQALAEYVSQPACFGCPFLNVAAEYPDPHYPGHQVALQHKESVRQRFYELAKQAGVRQPQVLADQLFLLMDGTYMTARMYGPKNPAKHLVEAVNTLIDSQLNQAENL